MEKLMLEEILKASNKNKYLKVNIILDRFRGQRVGGPSQLSSKLLLDDIFHRASNPQNLNFTFFQHNKVPRFFDFANKAGVNEIFGTFHSKQYIFDNTVILSGANLSEDYFTHRTDRYVYLNNVKDFADYLEDFNQIFSDLGDKLVKDETEISIRCNTLAEMKKQMNHRFKLFLYNNSLEPSKIPAIQENIDEFLSKKYNPIDFLFLYDKTNDFKNVLNDKEKHINETKPFQKETDHNSFIEAPISDYSEKYRRFSEILHENKNNSGNIILIPSFQIPMIDYVGEQDLFVSLLQFLISSNPNTNYEMTFTTGYFNPTDALLELFKKIPSNVKIEIIAAAPQANSFFKGKGFKGRVPGIYRVALQKWIGALSSVSNITFYEYAKSKSTYHSKGIWLLANNGNEVEYLTIYGSSNYAKRSYLKDLESQFLIFSQSPNEIKMFEDERKDIFRDCHKLTDEIISQDKTTRVSFCNKLIYKILRNFV